MDEADRQKLMNGQQLIIENQVAIMLALKEIIEDNQGAKVDLDDRAVALDERISYSRNQLIKDSLLSEDEILERAELIKATRADGRWRW